ncbi:MAG: hypothetical protein CSB13_11770 [Chloroflexi bacterium]|nr:MAG: hypothetical protein CSB13_11770 [Chloroflexota bacterium]
MQPIYRSDGEWVGVYYGGHLFNADGEWLGFTQGRDVYDPAGMYLGFLSDDRRLLRKRTKPEKPRLEAPPRPECPSLPSSMPLAPMLRALPHQYIDMFEEHPERLLFISETRPDMD